MRAPGRATVAALALLVAVCGRGTPAPAHPAKGSDIRGQAVWYAGGGQYGACGVKLTGHYAAHRTLPCGTRLHVHHKGHSVYVTVKDRGPYGSAVLDLAPAAFKVLAPLGAGRIWVRASVTRTGWAGQEARR